MDITWLFIGSATWTAVEVNIGIVSGKTLPIYRRSWPSYAISFTSLHFHTIYLLTDRKLSMSSFLAAPPSCYGG